MNEVLHRILVGSDAWRIFDGEMRRRPFHAYLVVSDDDVLREGMLQLMLLRIYCESACGSCAECRKILSGSKPDIVQPNPDGEPLTLGKHKLLEKVVEDTSLGSFEGGKKVYVLRSMHEASERVQNLLLKSLEEPAPSVVFLLGANHTGSILPTVLSRVKTLSLPPLSAGDVRSWLEEEGEAQAEVIARLASGNLTVAKAIHGRTDYFDKLQEVLDWFAACKRSRDVMHYIYAPMWSKEQIGETLSMMGRVVQDLLYIQCGRQDAVTYQNKLSALLPLSSEFSPRALPQVMELVETAKQKVAAYCGAANIADDLMLGILEVKSKW